MKKNKPIVLDLSNAGDARKFIKHFNKHFNKGRGGITYVKLSGGGMIELAKMTDDEAVFIAREFARMAEEGKNRMGMN